MKVDVRILRSNPKNRENPYFEAYRVSYTSGEKVLGVLMHIYRNVDPSLSFRFNCRGRHCGECSMVINGKPGLSCEVPITKELTLEPLHNLPVIKDLVIDRNKVYREILKYVRLRANSDYLQSFYPLTIDRINRMVRLDNCIGCLCCMSICPVYKKHPELFPGPLGVLIFGIAAERTDGLTMGEEAGMAEKLELCKLCGLCEEICPRNIPICSEVISKLKHILY